MAIEISLQKCLRLNEGCRNDRYLDHLGIPTIGVGFNLRRGDARDKIEGLGCEFDDVLNGEVELTDEQISDLLEPDMQMALDDLRIVFPDFDAIEPARQVILADMMFNLGRTRFSGFKKMIAAAKAGDWPKAAAQAEDSAWFRQVGDRGPRNIAALETGTLPEEYYDDTDGF